MERMELAAELWEENIKVWERNVSLHFSLYLLVMLTFFFPFFLFIWIRLQLFLYLIQALPSSMNMQMSTISNVLSF